MSDSDSELLTTNRVFTFQNESTTMSARGPNVNTGNLTGISFRNNMIRSTMNMSRNYEWQRRADPNFDQRSIGYRRETSPMSTASACDIRQRNYNNLYYGRGMSSHRSVYNGRSGSPMSMRSIDSNASDVVSALKNNQFSKDGIRMIKEACNKFIKHKVRKRVEKRRNLKLFLKGYRRKSGNDSGELGSNSSMSSDDNKSTRTLNCKNMSSCRSTKTDVADFRRTIKDSNMFKDCSDNFRQNRMQGCIGRPANMNSSRSSVSSFRSMIEKSHTYKTKQPKSMNPPENFSNIHTQSQSSVTLQDRFKNGFLLPSQRFNKSVAASSIPEAVEKPSRIHKGQNTNPINREHDIPSSPEELSDDEEIFLDVTAIPKHRVNHRKRSYDSDDICMPIQKKPKTASPWKNISQSFKNSTVLDKAKNDFEFAKPAFPVRKSANQKAKEKIISKSDIMNTKDELISKSQAPLSDSIIQPLQVNPILQPKIVKDDKIDESGMSQNTTDLSMRPSFIKRKLFTQKMDVTEKTNDITASPQNSVYGAIQKEKNKARKLVTSQYCLSRDIQAEDNNLLDLIHKIVPAERMNATNQTNKTAVNKSDDNDDKWDVTSIISTRNNDEDVSDTFTDEDILLVDGKKQVSPKVTKKKAISPLKITEKIVKKSPLKSKQVIHKILVDKNGTSKTNVQKYVKSFWDTDFESDAEGMPATRKEESKENKKSENAVQNIAAKVKFQSFSSMFPANKITVANNTTMMNSTVDTVQRLNHTNKSLRPCYVGLFSHRNNKPNVKITKESLKEDAKSVIEPQSKKQKASKGSCLDVSKQGNIDQNKHQTKQKTKPESKKTPPKHRKTKKPPEKSKEKELVKNQNSKQDKELKSNEKLKPQDKKTDTEQSKLGNKKDTSISLAQNKAQINKKSNTKNKTEAQNKDEKPQIKKTDVNNKQSTTQNKKAKEPNTTTQLNTTANNQKSTQKGNAKNTKSKLTDNFIYEEDSFIETNNNRSMRPVRSCRNSKQNDTPDSIKANNAINRSLRSRDPEKKTDENNKQSTTQNKKAKEQKTTTQLNTTANNNQKSTQKGNAKNTKSKLTDSIIYEDSFIETNNNRSMRPVRSCRSSKQNDTHDSSKTNNSLYRSLRSATKSKKITNENSVLSDLSFSLAQDKAKKPVPSCNSWFFKPQEIDTSDVSFSLNDKDSPLVKNKQGNSATSKTNTKLTQQVKNSLNERKPTRIRLSNRRYIS